MAKNYGHFNYGIHIEAFHINYTKFYQTFMKIWNFVWKYLQLKDKI